MCDVRLDHPSISRQHAAILHGSSGNPYILDLGSSHGTQVNHKKLPGHKRKPLKDGDVVKFGASSREYHVRLRLDESSDEESEEEPKRKSKKRKRAKDDDDESTSKKSKSDEQQVACRHILVKHKDSRRPHSWKEENITRTKEEAIEVAEGYLKKLRDAEKIEDTFEALAKTESDCNSNKRGGDLGKFGRGKMQKPFEEAAFELKVGELSEPVATLSGIHIIYRTA